MDLCTFTYCTIEPQPIVGATAGPLLLIGMLASVLAPPPRRFYDTAFAVAGATAGGLILALLWALAKGESRYLLMLSGAGCAAMSLAVWLGRGENDDPDGFEDSGPEPEPDPGFTIDWDDFSRKVEEERLRSRSPVSR